jgi:hypothetical protein
MKKIGSVQEIGGWASLRMLERYARPTGDEMAKAVRVLAEHTGTKTGTSTWGEPELIDPAHRHAAGEVQRHFEIMRRVGRHDERSRLNRQEVVFAHDP